MIYLIIKLILNFTYLLKYIGYILQILIVYYIWMDEREEMKVGEGEGPGEAGWQKDTFNQRDDGSRLGKWVSVSDEVPAVEK